MERNHAQGPGKFRRLNLSKRRLPQKWCCQKVPQKTLIPNQLPKILSVRKIQILDPTCTLTKPVSEKWLKYWVFVFFAFLLFSLGWFGFCSDPPALFAFRAAFSADFL